jgi:hypothetical protein
MQIEALRKGVEDRRLDISEAMLTEMREKIARHQQVREECRSLKEALAELHLQTTGEPPDDSAEPRQIVDAIRRTLHPSDGSDG